MPSVPAVQFETNVDDLDPRLWPHVVQRLLDEGAHDAWVTPMLMKKGRPAHTLSALCDPTDAARIRTVIFRETSTLGLREWPVTKHVLDRVESSVEVDGRTIGVKVAALDGEEINRSVEWDDVAAAAEALGLTAKDVLAMAGAAARPARR